MRRARPAGRSATTCRRRVEALEAGAAVVVAVRVVPVEDERRRRARSGRSSRCVEPRLRRVAEADLQQRRRGGSSTTTAAATDDRCPRGHVAARQAVERGRRRRAGRRRPRACGVTEVPVRRPAARTNGPSIPWGGRRSGRRARSRAEVGHVQSASTPRTAEHRRHTAPAPRARAPGPAPPRGTLFSGAEARRRPRARATRRILEEAAVEERVDESASMTAASARPTAACGRRTRPQRPGGADEQGKEERERRQRRAPPRPSAASCARRTSSADRRARRRAALRAAASRVPTPAIGWSRRRARSARPARAVARHLLGRWSRSSAARNATPPATSTRRRPTATSRRPVAGDERDRERDGEERDDARLRVGEVEARPKEGDQRRGRDDRQPSQPEQHEQDRDPRTR